MSTSTLIDQLTIQSPCFSHILNYVPAKDLFKIQTLNKVAYQKVIPEYFVNSLERKNTLSKLSMARKDSARREAFLFFAGFKRFWRNNKHLGYKWTKSEFRLDSKFQTDWSKAIAIDDDRVFVSGGENLDEETSTKAFIIDVKTGKIREISQMKTARQGHGITMANGYVYCCAGFNYATDSCLSSCERFSLMDETWQHDVPDMPAAMVALTMLTVDKIWIYSFSENKDQKIQDSDHVLQVNKLNTMKLQSWEQLLIQTPSIIGCQLGVIHLTKSASHLSTNSQRKFQIFGGITEDPSNMSLIFNEDINNFQESTVTQPDQPLPISDRFYFRYQFKITDFPTITDKSYSENLVVAIGRMGLHIYDIDQERWLMNTGEGSYQYDSLAEQIYEGEIEDSSDEQPIQQKLQEVEEEKQEDL